MFLQIFETDCVSTLLIIDVVSILGNLIGLGPASSAGSSGAEIEEVEEAIKKTRAGKAAGLDGIPPFRLLGVVIVDAVSSELAPGSNSILSISSFVYKDMNVSRLAASASERL
jgi:hypothetical protein